MIKIKWFNKDEEKPTLSIKVEGSIEVKAPSYDTYEEYVKKKKKESLQKEVEKYVEGLLKDPLKINRHEVYHSDPCERANVRGFARAQEELVKLIMKEIEID